MNAMQWSWSLTLFVCLVSELPHFIESQIGAAMLTLTFSKVFSNLMLIDLFITNNTRRTMEECHFQISISGVSHHFSLFSNKLHRVVGERSVIIITIIICAIGSYV